MNTYLLEQIGLPYNAPELLKKYYELGHVYNRAVRENANSRNKFARLDAQKKSVFAKVIDSQEGKSRAEKEHKAHNDPTWLEWLERYIKAMESYYSSQASEQIAKTNWEECRTFITTLRKEMETLGGN